MHTLMRRPGLATAAVTALGLVLAGCSSGSGSSDQAAEPDSGAASASSPATEDVVESPSETTPEPAGADVGPAAAAGEGTLDVAGTTYPLTITNCTFTEEGPTEGTFEVEGTTDGGTFEMTQFFLNGDWSQTDVQVDTGDHKIYVIRTASSSGANPATVDNGNVTYVDAYRDLDEPANSQVELGEGTLNLTCP